MNTPFVLLRWWPILAGGLSAALFAQPVAPTPEQIAQMRGIEAASLRLSRASAEPMVVNPATRAESRAFYQAVFFSGVDAPIQWTGTISGTPGSSATGTPGTTSASFKEAVRTRINWYRAMAGLPAQIAFNDTYSAKSQQAALMMSANNTLSHTPPASWLLYTADGSEAAGSSNLALGSCGVDSIDGYMIDPYSNNTAAGHRRWVLYPQTQTMGTGDVPRTGSFSPANSTWVFDSYYGTSRPAVRDSYVAWPTKGYVPYTVVPARWSFSYPNANFSNATVTVTKNGASVSAVKESLAGNIGENSLVWIVDGLDTNSLQPHSRPSSDTIYSVTVSGISGAPQSSYSYNVVVYDPDVAGTGEVSASISGTSSPTVGASESYTVSLPTFASSYSWRTILLSAGPALWGAESGTSPDLVASITGSYASTDTGLSYSGSASYHLCHPTPDSQTLTVPGFYHVNTSGSPALSFASRLGGATTAQTAHVQISADEGVSWGDLYAQSGTSSWGEMSFTARTVSLAAYAGRVVRFRFLYSFDGGSYTDGTDASYGWWIDNVMLSGVRTATSGGGQSVSAGTPFTFTPSAATQIGLQACPVLFRQYPMEWGAVKLLSPVVSVGPSISTQPSNESVRAGSAVSFSVVAAGSGTVSYQWQVSTDSGSTWGAVTDGATYAGAGTSTLALSTVSSSMNGYRYRCSTTDSTGTRLSSVAVLSVGWTQFSALSARAQAGTGDATLIAGFVFAGNGKPTMVRGVGPGISAQVSNYMADPKLSLMSLEASGWTQVDTNDDWDSSAGMRAKFAELGLGALSNGSKDAAIYATALAGRVYSAHVSGVSGSGVVLAEVYDGDFADKSKRLTALSVRNHVGTDSSILIVGFVLAGDDVPKRVIIRGVGPGISATVPSYLHDPKLEVYKLDGSAWTKVAENDDWDGSAATSQVFQQAGMGALTVGSKDAALITDLDRGVYTAQISGVGSTTGVALVEIYEAP